MFIKSNKVAQTPPMGWNSWDCFAANVTEEQLMANARYMRDHLKDHGWQYVVCDIQWSEPLAGTEEGEYRPFATLCLMNTAARSRLKTASPAARAARALGRLPMKSTRWVSNSASILCAAFRARRSMPICPSLGQR